jgi:hypothetical protein
LCQHLPEEVQRRLIADIYALAQNLPFCHDKSVSEEVEHDKEKGAALGRQAKYVNNVSEGE